MWFAFSRRRKLLHELWNHNELGPLVEMIRKTPPILLCAFLLASQAAAGSRLLNYENRVVRAAEQIERIKADPEYSEEGIAFIKQRLPRSEKIDFEGHEVSVE